MEQLGEAEGANWNLAIERDSSHDEEEVEDDEFDIDLFGATDSTPLAPPVIRREKRQDPSAKKR